MAGRSRGVSDFRGTIHRITTLGLDNDDEALRLLTKACNLVKPILKKHEWTVPLVAEFVPRSPNLLGLNTNGGERIQIRLRRPGGSFYDYRHILGTLLHELCHCDVGPHNAAFYKLLDTLWEEAEALEDKGYTGEGDDGSGGGGSGKRVLGTGSGGQMLGGNHSPLAMAPLSASVMKSRAVAAAERRTQKQAIMGSSGGRVLGGSAASATRLTPREMAALAAEQRARDSLSCGHFHGGNEDEGSGSGRGGGGSEWSCARCTLRNPAAGSECRLCGHQRGASVDDVDDSGLFLGGDGGVGGSQETARVGSETILISDDDCNDQSDTDGTVGLGSGSHSHHPVGGDAPVATSTAVVGEHSGSAAGSDGGSGDDVIEISDGGRKRASSSERALPSKRPKSAGGNDDHSGDSAAASGDGWACATCTFVNRAQFLCCEVCGAALVGGTPLVDKQLPSATPTARPAGGDDVWRCLECRAPNIRSENDRACRACGHERAVALPGVTIGSSAGEAVVMDPSQFWQCRKCLAVNARTGSAICPSCFSPTG